MQYKITLDVFEVQNILANKTKGTSVEWTLVSTFHLSPSQTVGRSKTGRVRLHCSELNTLRVTCSIPCYVITFILVCIYASRSVKKVIFHNYNYS